MLILQTPLYLNFFGFPEAAATLEKSDDVVRKLLFPRELAGAMAMSGSAS
jgi:shikimate dehydrogenase